jgi:hypothetical protein
MGKGYNHHDYMDSALAPIEAQRDDAMEELAKVKAENAALLAALEEILDGNRNGWIARVAREAIAKAKGGE